ncbi:non-canonical purine NTP diphosphatase [Maribacter antarcticus]|uniref:non-canonical purine NTP diphosphatase n=1 Tax=Maribacter antarcticus TaxID=505250 RepID=UPI00047C0B81|nr:non-canonical purine NTP diphosphatase [Maribacter antarcticus]
MKLVFATHNQNKLKEIQALVPDHIQLISLQDIGCTEAIPETADTLQGNAKLKADYVTNNYNLPCFADDTGLFVDALNGEPGIYTARYAGAESGADANVKKLLENLLDKKNRAAHFSTYIALNIEGETLLFEGSAEGVITKKKKGENGFGYDPIFKPAGHDRTFAELPLATKNKMSHRAKAFTKLIAFLNKTNTNI